MEAGCGGGDSAWRFCELRLIPGFVLGRFFRFPFSLPRLPYIRRERHSPFTAQPSSHILCRRIQADLTRLSIPCEDFELHRTRQPVRKILAKISTGNEGLPG